MTLPKTDPVYLQDILEAAEDAQAFVESMTYEEFSANKMAAYAVIHAFQVIGEAAKKGSPHLKDRQPEIPWRVMAGMRDRLVHDYSGVDLAVLWRTIHENLPQMTSRVRLLLSEIQG